LLVRAIIEFDSAQNPPGAAVEEQNIDVLLSNAGEGNCPYFGATENHISQSNLRRHTNCRPENAA